MTVCYYQVTWAVQSESALYTCLNVTELLARNRRALNHLVKLAKWLSVRLRIGCRFKSRCCQLRDIVFFHF